MDRILESFFEADSIESGPIHNELSLQLELALFFRTRGFPVQLEKRYLVESNLGSTRGPKKDLDLLVEHEHQRVGIELKLPVNGRHPETLYDYCHDIEFLEALVRHRSIDTGYAVLATTDRAFWTDSGRGSPIHNLFRVAEEMLTGVIQKPTGGRETQIAIVGRYHASSSWKRIRGNLFGRAAHM